MSRRGPIRPFQQQSVSSVSGENIKSRRLISAVGSTKVWVVWIVFFQFHKQQIHLLNCQVSLVFCPTLEPFFIQGSFCDSASVLSAMPCVIFMELHLLTPESPRLFSTKQLHQSPFTFPVQ